MGKGGSPPPPNQQVTTTTSNLPEYAQPYFENLLQRGQAESYRQYQPYEAERLAGFTPGQMAVQQETMGMQTPGQFGVGTGLAGAGGLASLGAGQEFFGMAKDPASMQAFMSPYQQSVTDVAKQSALREAQMAQKAANLQAGRRMGGLGSSGNILAQAERERGALDRMSQIQAEGSQKAFEDARRTMQFGSDLGLRGYGQGIQAGQALGQMGTAQQQADIQRLTAQEAVGGQQQALEQRKLDQQYADFLRQRDYPMEQLGYYSNLLRGLPMTMGSTQTTYAPPPSMISQIGGLGLAGLGIAGAAKTAGFAEGGSITASPSPEELHAMGSRMPDAELAMLQDRLRTAPPGNETLMAAGEIQTRKNIRDKAVQGNKRLVIADLLTDGAMPPMPQMPPEMQQQMPQAVAMLPENAGGVAGLPAPNMDNIATMAAGGMVAFDDGGSVARFDVGGTPFFAEGNRPLQTTAGLSRRQYTQEELDEFRRRKEMGILGGVKEFVLDPVHKFLTSGSGRQDLRVARNQAAYGQNMFAREGDPSGTQYTGIEDVPFSNMAPVAAALSDSGAGAGTGTGTGAGALQESNVVPQPTDAAKQAQAGAGIPRLGDAMALGKQFAGDTKDIEKQLKDLPTAEKSATEQFDLYKKMGVDLDPYKALKESLNKEKSEEGKARTQAGFMALANFGFSLATQRGPFGEALGKAGKETFPGFQEELKDLGKLARDRVKTMADINATDSKMRKDVTDAGIAKLAKRRERLEGRLDQITDNAARISGTIYGSTVAAQTSLGIAGMPGKEERLVDRAMVDPKFAEAYQKLNKPTGLDPRVKLFMDMPYAEKMQLKANNPTQYAMLEQLASAALLPATVGTPDPSKIRP